MGQKQIKIVQNEQLKTIISSQYWTLSKQQFTKDNGKYRRLQCKKFFTQCTKNLKVKKLDLSANNEPSIPQDIMRINFTLFLILDLSGNYICSIQKLAFLNIKNLEILILEWNFITSLDNFHKSCFLNLQKLKICNNPLLTFGKFERKKNRKLKQIWLQTSNQTQQKVSDALWRIVKMDSFELYTMNMSAKKRIDKCNSRTYKSIRRLFSHHLSLSKN